MVFINCLFIFIDCSKGEDVINKCRVNGEGAESKKVLKCTEEENHELGRSLERKNTNWESTRLKIGFLQ
jgi:hypothetical protein